MGKNHLERPMQMKEPSDKTGWPEVLATVLSDIFPTSQNIEFVLDRLERAP